MVLSRGIFIACICSSTISKLRLEFKTPNPIVARLSLGGAVIRFGGFEFMWHTNFCV